MKNAILYSLCLCTLLFVSCSKESNEFRQSVLEGEWTSTATWDETQGWLPTADAANTSQWTIFRNDGTFSWYLICPPVSQGTYQYDQGDASLDLQFEARDVNGDIIPASSRQMTIELLSNKQLVLSWPGGKTSFERVN